MAAASAMPSSRSGGGENWRGCSGDLLAERAGEFSQRGIEAGVHWGRSLGAAPR
jgi:hypothetical protein